MSTEVPVIVITDLYHPAQDVGDNFDILTAYSLPGIDLLAVILDVTDKFRHPVANDENPMFRDMRGIARDPGIVAMHQLNYIYNRQVPFAPGPFRQMRAPDDRMDDGPLYGQAGIALIVETLRRADNPVEILIFGSSRTLAAAYNREPELLARKIGRVHLCAGSSEPEFLEWNVLLDPHAVTRLLTCGLPIAIYPCATGEGPFAYGRHNSFWKLPDLQFIRGMHPALRRYLVFAFDHEARMDFLRAVEETEAPEDVLDRICNYTHNVWETAVWAEVAGLKLVRLREGTCRLIAPTGIRDGDVPLPGELRPCRITVRPDASFAWSPSGETDVDTLYRIYDRGDPHENERALRDALPALYLTYKP